MHFQRIKDQPITTVSKPRLVTRHKRIREAMERIVFRTHLHIHATESRQGFGFQSRPLSRLMAKLTAWSTRIQSMLCANIGTGMPVTGGTRGATVRTHLHVPKQCLAQQDGLLPIHDIIVQIRWQRNGFSVQRTGSNGWRQNFDISYHRAVRYSRIFRREPQADGTGTGSEGCLNHLPLRIFK